MLIDSLNIQRFRGISGSLPLDFTAPLTVLYAPNGTGKTSISRGIGRGLGCTTQLRSPTYLLCQEHQGRHPVLHLDAYFEARMDSLLGEGLCERFDQEHVLLVEWSDRLQDWWPEDRLEIRLKVDQMGRYVQLFGIGPRSSELLQKLKKSWEREQKG